MSVLLNVVWASSHAIWVQTETSGNFRGIFAGLSPLGSLFSFMASCSVFWLYFAHVSDLAIFLSMRKPGMLSCEMRVGSSVGMSRSTALVEGGKTSVVDHRREIG